LESPQAEYKIFLCESNANPFVSGDITLPLLLDIAGLNFNWGLTGL